MANSSRKKLLITNLAYCRGIIVVNSMIPPFMSYTLGLETKNFHFLNGTFASCMKSGQIMGNAPIWTSKISIKECWMSE